MTHPAIDSKDPPSLEGGMLWTAGIVLALSNFVAVLNMTIANVTVPNIAGALGAGSSQGTWVITSYAVAEAITVPLTGWLSGRFGAVRLFCIAVVLFGLCSLLCGLSTSLPMLLGMRVLQGMAGGPLMALSQTLLLQDFSQAPIHAGDGSVGHDDAARARGRSGVGRLAVRSVLLALGVPDQRTHGAALRRPRLVHAQALSGAGSHQACRQGRHAAFNRLGGGTADHAR